MLNSLKALSSSGDCQPNYIRFGLEANDGEFRFPPTTHFIDTIKDLTDMLDYGSEDIDSMDDDAGEEQAQKPPPLGQWTATSSYDIYMVDTPKENEADGDNSMPVDEPPKRRRPKRRP